jgi:hypothetical protein
MVRWIQPEELAGNLSLMGVTGLYLLVAMLLAYVLL